jgi:hypothetical protein
MMGRSYDTRRLALGGPARPLRPRPGHQTPPFSIEKHFVLPPTLYAATKNPPLFFFLEYLP